MEVAKKRYTVLTYNFGNCEPVREVLEKDPAADYVLVTDDVNTKSKTWRVVWAHTNSKKNVWQKCYDVRYHPFGYAGTDIVVRLDASIEIRKPLTPIIDEMERGGYDRCLMIHPHRSTMTDEYDTWCKERGYPEDQASDMLHIMGRLGYNQTRKGLFQSCFEVIRRNRVNQLINDITFDLLRYAAPDSKIQRISQTWFSMVVNHLFADHLKVLPVSQDIITDGNMMQWYRHGTWDAITVRPSIAPLMFGREVAVWDGKPEADLCGRNKV